MTVFDWLIASELLVVGILLLRLSVPSYTKLVVFGSMVPFALAAHTLGESILLEFREYGGIPQFSYLRWYVVYFLVSVCVAVIVAMLFQVRGAPSCSYSLSRIVVHSWWERIILFAFCVGLFKNLSHVDFSLAMLLIDARAHELQFGKSTVSNYLYFLGPVAFCNVIYRRLEFRERRWWDSVVCILLVVSSALHGIKFTVFDQLFIPALFLAALRPQRAVKVLIAVAVVAVSSFTLFGSLVRGGSGVVEEYVLSGFLNLSYMAEGVHWPYSALAAIVPEELASRVFPAFSTSNWGAGGFIVNEKYNMASALPALAGFAFPFGMAALLGSCLVGIKYASRRSAYSAAFLSALLHVEFVMLFYYHSLAKDKYWYLFAVTLAPEALLWLRNALSRYDPFGVSKSDRSNATRCCCG